jgi:integrase
MNWGITLLGGLPTAQVRNPTKPRGRDRRVTPGEVDKILDASESVKLRTTVTLAVETAMHRGELASLEWVNIDKANRLSPQNKVRCSSNCSALNDCDQSIGKYATSNQQ